MSMEKRGLDITNPPAVKVSLIQTHVEKIFPQVVVLDLKPEEWETLARKTEKNKYLTKGNLLQHLTEITGLSYEQLLSKLTSRILPPRKAKRSLDSESSAIPLKKRRRFNGDKGPNCFIVETKDVSPVEEPILLEQGVRITDLTPLPNTNHKTTPKKTRVRPVFENNHIVLFKPCTPEGKKAAQGAIKPKKCARKLDLHRPDSLQFVVTREKILSRKNMKRYRSQQQVTGMRCEEVFLNEGCEVEIRKQGSEYHWSHLIAWFLGGEQSRKNLIAGTAVSNYNTLKLVERFIEEKLSDLTISEINMTVNPIFEEDSNIPTLLEFNLDWKENQQSCFEKISINPRTYCPVNRAMQETIASQRTHYDSMVIK